MLIRTQGERAPVKDGIVDAIEISTCPNGKKGFYVFAGIANPGFLSDGRICVATYATMAEVSAELDAMVEYFEAHPQGIYKMK